MNPTIKFPALRASKDTTAQVEDTTFALKEVQTEHEITYLTVAKGYGLETHVNAVNDGYRMYTSRGP